MKISKVNSETAREQRVILAKITTRRQKIAALQAEIDALQNQLVNVAAENAGWWDGHVPTDYTVPQPVCSEMNIPMPTAVPEKIRITAAGMFSNFDAVTR